MRNSRKVEGRMRKYLARRKYISDERQIKFRNLGEGCCLLATYVLKLELELFYVRLNEADFRSRSTDEFAPIKRRSITLITTRLAREFVSSRRDDYNCAAKCVCVCWYFDAGRTSGISL